MLRIFLISRCRGTVSKALLMSIVAISVRYAGLAEFIPSSIVCVKLVRSVLVECLVLKPCWEAESGMYGLMTFRTSLSSILEGVQSNEMGLYDAGSVGGLLGLSMGMIFAIFHMLGKLLFWIEWLKMLVKALTPYGPRCFR